MSYPVDPAEMRVNHVAALATTRASLRREKIAAREALSAAQHAQLSASLGIHLADFLRHSPPTVLGFCWPYRGEFDCRPLVVTLLATGVRACLPWVKGEEEAMDFREWRPDSTLLTDRHGIPFPASGARLLPDLLLIPVNAFDAQGFRIGYGSGYFDRTLKSLDPKPLSLGVGFELARVATIQPEIHDIPLDAVVTETGLELYSDRARSHISAHKRVK